MKYKKIIITALTLMIICAITALCLAFVNSITKGPIAAAEQKAKDEAIIAIFPLAERYEAVDYTKLSEISVHISACYRIFTDGEISGYVVEVDESSGFGGDILMMVGITSNGEVSAVEIIKHSETAGFGANIEKENFRNRFKGLNTKAVIGENVDALSGATISSRAVAAGVNSALEVYLALSSIEETTTSAVQTENTPPTDTAVTEETISTSPQTSEGDITTDTISSDSETMTGEAGTGETTNE